VFDLIFAQLSKFLHLFPVGLGVGVERNDLTSKNKLSDLFDHRSFV
jgi:hypothetical protein